MSLYALLAIIAIGIIFTLLASGCIGSRNPNEIPHDAFSIKNLLDADSSCELLPHFITKGSPIKPPLAVVLAYERDTLEDLLFTENILSIAYQILDPEGYVIKEISTKLFLKDHSSQVSLEAKSFFFQLLEDLSSAKWLVMHHVEEEISSIHQFIELCGLSPEALYQVESYSTMLYGADKVRLYDANGTWRYPLRSELYGVLFKRKHYIRIITSNKALSNCRMTARSFVKLQIKKE